jgi:hypothetical protein
MSLQRMQFTVHSYGRHISLNITDTQSKGTDQPTKLVQQTSAAEPNSVLPQLVENSLIFYRTQQFTAMFTTA